MFLDALTNSTSVSSSVGPYVRTTSPLPLSHATAVTGLIEYSSGLLHTSNLIFRKLRIVSPHVVFEGYGSSRKCSCGFMFLADAIAFFSGLIASETVQAPVKCQFIPRIPGFDRLELHLRGTSCLGGPFPKYRHSPLHFFDSYFTLSLKAIYSFITTLIVTIPSHHHKRHHGRSIPTTLPALPSTQQISHLSQQALPRPSNLQTPDGRR